MADSGYDPYEHRELARPISNFGALITVVKAVVGTGILASPMAFRNAGWVLGIIGTCFFGFVIILGKHLLLYGMYEVEKRRKIPLLTYGEALSMAMEEGPPCLQYIRPVVNCIVDIMLFMNNFGVCCVYVVFVAKCLKWIGDQYWEKLDSRIYMATLILPLIAIYMLPDLKALVPYAAAANLVLLIGFGIIFYYMFTNLGAFEDMKAFQEPSQYHLFVGSTMFALDAPALLVSVEGNMANPAAYLGICGILSASVFVIVIIQICFAFFGYWRYGDEIEAAILQSLPPDSPAALIAQILFLVAIYISHPVQGTVPIDVGWHKHLEKKVPEEKSFLFELIYRVCLVTLSVLIAIICPDLTLILAFVGAFAKSNLSMILPAVMHLCVKSWTGYGPAYIHMITIVFFLVLGASAFVIGLYIPINAIITKFQGD